MNNSFVKRNSTEKRTFVVLFFSGITLLVIWFVFPKKNTFDPSSGIDAVATSIGFSLTTNHSLFGRIYTKIVMRNYTDGVIVATPQQLTKPLEEKAIWNYSVSGKNGHVFHEGKCIVQRMGFQGIPIAQIDQILEAKGFSIDGDIMSEFKDGNGTLIYESLSNSNTQRVEIDYKNAEQTQLRIYEDGKLISSGT